MKPWPETSLCCVDHRVDAVKVTAVHQRLEAPDCGPPSVDVVAAWSSVLGHELGNDEPSCGLDQMFAEFDVAAANGMLEIGKLVAIAAKYGVAIVDV